MMCHGGYDRARVFTPLGARWQRRADHCAGDKSTGVCESASLSLLFSDATGTKLRGAATHGMRYSADVPKEPEDPAFAAKISP
jgi:hypothetical protein